MKNKGLNSLFHLQTQSVIIDSNSKEKVIWGLLETRIKKQVKNPKPSTRRTISGS